MRYLVCLALMIFAIADTPAHATDIVGIPTIVDGDTVEIAGKKIRLEGIDAPETDQICLDAKGERWACGIAARDHLSQKAGGKFWKCHVAGTDRYKRSLASCDVDGLSVNQWIVANGWALSFVRYSHQYDAVEETARRGNAGLWAGAFIAPWDWRHRNKNTLVLGAIHVPMDAQSILIAPASAADAPSQDCIIKSVSRNGQCIYHLPGDAYYSSINMKTKGKRWFCSAEGAEAAGCRAPKS
jgi:endonuclease YncB( thermonuclease family)